MSTAARIDEIKGQKPVAFVVPEPGAEQVAIAALSASLRTSCEPSRLEEVQQRAKRLLLEPAHDARWTPTLQSLASITPKTCDGLQTAKSAP